MKLKIIKKVIKMLLDIKDWDFSTYKQCEICEDKPADYWNMAHIEYKGKTLWICTTCLGYIICNMPIRNKHGLLMKY